MSRRGRERTRRLRAAWPGALAGVVAAALALAALRMDAIHLRYRLGEAQREERALAERARELTAEVRELRDPLALRRRASALGFVAPARIIELPPRLSGEQP